MIEDIRALTRSFTRSDDYPASNIAKLVSARAFSAPFAPALGGAGVGLAEAVEIVEAIAEACAGTALLASMPLGLAGAVAAGVKVAPPAHRDAAVAQLEAMAADYRGGKIYAACNSEKGAGAARSQPPRRSRRRTRRARSC